MCHRQDYRTVTKTFFWTDRAGPVLHGYRLYGQEDAHFYPYTIYIDYREKLAQGSNILYVRSLIDSNANRRTLDIKWSGRRYDMMPPQHEI